MSVLKKYNESSGSWEGVGVAPDLSAKENTSNKVTSISSSSTDTQYPSAKCVYDAISANAASLLFTNQTIATSAWVSDSTYSDFPYRAALALSGVTASDFASVALSPDDALSGDYAPVATTYAGGIYLYRSSVASATVTIPSICIIKG